MKKISDEDSEGLVLNLTSGILFQTWTNYLAVLNFGFYFFQIIATLFTLKVFL